MSRREWTCLGFVLSAALSLAGCGAPGGKNAAVKPPGAGGKSVASRKTGAGVDDLNPENSMRRDLQQLQERERQQIKAVEEMRTALSQGEGMIAGEEKKLSEIRSQIARYEDALRTYGKGAYEEEASRRAAVPASYAPQPRGSANNYWDNRQAAARERAGNETVLYDSRAAAAAPPPAPRVKEEVVEKPFAGAPVTRSRYPEPSRRPELEENTWNPPTNLFSNQATPPRFDPTPTASARSEAAASGSLRPAAKAAPAPAPAPAPAAVFAPAPAETHVAPEDEVFVPDLRF